MILAHKIALDPTEKQRQYFIQAAGMARFTYNWGLEKWNGIYEKGEKSSGREIKKLFNSIKYKEFPWLKNIHRDAHSEPFHNLQMAFNSYFKKKGKKPRFKKKGKRDSFYIANDRIRVEQRNVYLPKIGGVKMRELLCFYGKIMGATVSREVDRWFISIQVDVDDYKKQCGEGVVGVDLGVKHLATLSTGEKIKGPKPLRNAKRLLVHRSKQHSRKRLGSSNRKKSVMKLACLHRRIKNIRNDSLHKLTTQLCRENQMVVIEDLVVKGMMANRKLAFSVSDMGFGEFRRQLEYKSYIFGTKIVVADRWFPSSKKCSNCGTVLDQLLLSERIFCCNACGFEIDRDFNAALNLYTLGLREINACGQNSSTISKKKEVVTTLVEAGTKPYSIVGTN